MKSRIVSDAAPSVVLLLRRIVSDAAPSVVLLLRHPALVVAVCSTKL